jgi:RNA polymerase sigma-70 factor (ECF subfamily)
MTRATAEERPVPAVRSVLSFDEVYDRHFRFVWRVLRASGLPASMVEDAAQDVFVVVHRRLAEFEGRSDIRTWLFRIASWVVTSERRKLKAKRAHETDADESVSEVRDKAAGPFELVARSEAVRKLERVLAQMDAEKRMAFLLMDIEEMKAAEVAELLEINVNTVYSRLRLAREQFKLLLREGAQASEGSAP